MAAAAARLPVKMNEVHAVTTPAVNRQPAALTNDRSGVSVIMSSAIITGAHSAALREASAEGAAAAVRSCGWPAIAARGEASFAGARSTYDDAHATNRRLKRALRAIVQRVR